MKMTKIMLAVILTVSLIAVPAAMALANSDAEEPTTESAVEVVEDTSPAVVEESVLAPVEEAVEETVPVVEDPVVEVVEEVVSFDETPAVVAQYGPPPAPECTVVITGVSATVEGNKVVISGSYTGNADDGLAVLQYGADAGLFSNDFGGENGVFMGTIEIPEGFLAGSYNVVVVLFEGDECIVESDPVRVSIVSVSEPEPEPPVVEDNDLTPPPAANTNTPATTASTATTASPRTSMPNTGIPVGLVMLGLLSPVIMGAGYVVTRLSGRKQ